MMEQACLESATNLYVPVELLQPAVAAQPGMSSWTNGRCANPDVVHSSAVRRPIPHLPLGYSIQGFSPSQPPPPPHSHWLTDNDGYNPHIPTQDHPYHCEPSATRGVLPLARRDTAQENGTRRLLCDPSSAQYDGATNTTGYRNPSTLPVEPAPQARTRLLDRADMSSKRSVLCV